MVLKDLMLRPKHIVDVSATLGHTHFTIKLPNMTWSAHLVTHGSIIYGVIFDEYDVPLEDGYQILRWILVQPEFVGHLRELAREPGHTRAGLHSSKSNSDDD